MTATSEQSRTIPITCNRTLVLDLLRHAQKIPLFPVDREMKLGRVARAREAASRKISWTALFMKAFGIASREIPPLRRAFLTWPYARMYEHPHSIANIVVARQYRGEPRLCWGVIPNPEAQSLVDLQRRLDEFRGGDVKQSYLDQTRLSRAPGWIRRPIWSYLLHTSGRRRVEHFGTFAMSVLAQQGCTIRNFPILNTAGITFSPPGPDGPPSAMMVGDHRVADGLVASTALRRTEAILRRQLAEELESLGDAQLPAAA